MRIIIGSLLSVAAALTSTACSDSNPAGPNDQLQAPSGMIVSNALANRGAADMINARASLGVNAGNIAYVSAAPGTFSSAVRVAIRNRTRNSSEVVGLVFDGGFDPIGIAAEAGDELSLSVFFASGRATSSELRVPPRRPPVIVRTEPSKGRTDVALNVQIAIVFSEPIERSSATPSSIGLFHDGNAVSGKVAVSADGLSVQFIPNSDLEPETTYTLALSQSVRDLDGDPLEETPPTTFKTGTSRNTGSIELSISTSGADPDPDGYIVSISYVGGNLGMKVPVNDVETITLLKPGAYGISIYGLTPNCTVSGPSQQTVTVNAGKTTSLGFALRCVPAGSLRITTVTTGVDPDDDGYVLFESRLRGIIDWDKGLAIGLLPPNGTVTESALIAGSYTLIAENIAPNCTPAVPLPVNVSITAGVETSLTFEVNCNEATQIAFVRGAGEQESIAANIANTDIYVAKSNGKGTARLTSSPGADLNPAWSPDGSKIAFASDRAGNREIFVMNADGSDPVRLTSNPSADYLPAWSPDGKRIAFVSERDGNAEIYVMNGDGTNLSRLTHNSTLDTEPAWSPDGSRIAFSSGDNMRKAGDIYVMNADGSAVTQLTFGSDLSNPNAEPTWSPDGKRIAFRGQRNPAAPGGPGYPYIHTMNADGSDMKPLSNWVPTFAHHPDWSPDGKLIAFDDWDCWQSGPCPRGIIISNDAGSISIQIDDASEPAWRPRN